MKRNRLLTILASISIAACGGKTKSDTTPPGGGDGSRTDATDPDGDGTGMETPPDAEPDEDPHEAMMAAEMSAWDSAKPVIEKYCGGCHIEGGAKATEKKLEHINFTRYPIESHHADTLTTTIGHVLGIDGSKPSMPMDKPGTVKGDDLELIQAWIAAYDAADTGGAHEPHEHHHDITTTDR